MKTKIILLVIFSVFVCHPAMGQKTPKYTYAAQKALIPAELGRIYIGMRLKEFAAKYDLGKATIGDTRFDWLEIEVPLSKGNIRSLTVKVFGLNEEEKTAILRKETIVEKNAIGEETTSEVDRLTVGKIPASGFIYAMYISFKPKFDQKAFVIKMYGHKGTVRKKDDKYRFSDIEWTKKTPDGLLWLIRSLHEGDDRSLQLLGRIDGTEWGLDGVN